MFTLVPPVALHAQRDRLRCKIREASARVDPSLRPGLVFMTMHFPDDIDTNVLTIEAIDPKSGTAEFKASAVRVEKLEQFASAGGD